MRSWELLPMALLLFGSTAFAEPAPWWEWKNVKTGAIVCTQTTPGPGWVRYSGPYSDLRCTARVVPK